jgi:hypothetical protein
MLPMYFSVNTILKFVSVPSHLTYTNTMPLQLTSMSNSKPELTKFWIISFIQKLINRGEKDDRMKKMAVP